MPRSGAEARDRLERAALELFTERGYDRTTAADIAARAGVTGRTFFRHFADKREVVGWPGGVSPPGSHGTVRDSLPSHGSSHPGSR